MVMEKQRLSLEELDAQAGFELPERDMLLITVVVTNVLNNLSVSVSLRDINVALQVCAVVQDINAILVDDKGRTVARLACDIRQR